MTAGKDLCVKLGFIVVNGDCDFLLMWEKKCDLSRLTTQKHKALLLYKMTFIQVLSLLYFTVVMLEIKYVLLYETTMIRWHEPIQNQQLDEIYQVSTLLLCCCKRLFYFLANDFILSLNSSSGCV